jgi:regulatory protein
MKDSDPFQRASSAALRFLSHRPRSEAEVRTRLGRRFPLPIVDRVLDDLKDRGLVNDAEFAALWRDSRSSFNPRSAASIRRELAAKGVARDIVDDAVRNMDDLDSACRAGRRLAQRLVSSNFTSFHGRLRGHLHRRGFSTSVARRAISLLWDEQRAGASAASLDDGDTGTAPPGRAGL